MKCYTLNSKFDSIKCYIYEEIKLLKTWSSSWSKSTLISFRAIFPKMVSSIGLAVWAFLASSDIGFFAAQSEIFYFFINYIFHSRINSQGVDNEKYAYEL